MLSDRLIAAGKACDAANAELLKLLQEVVNAGPMSAMTYVDKIFAAIEDARLARAHYADLLEAEISGIEDRLTTLEQNRG